MKITNGPIFAAAAAAIGHLYMLYENNERQNTK